MTPVNRMECPVVPKSVAEVDLMDVEIQECPYPAYKTLREQAPVYRDRLTGFYLAMSVGGVLYMVPMGFAGAVAIRVAQARGAVDVDNSLRTITFAALALVSVWLTAAALILGKPAALVPDLPLSAPGRVRSRSGSLKLSGLFHVC